MGGYCLDCGNHPCVCGCPEDRSRQNLEWLVFFCLEQEDPCISFGRGKELLGFRYMEEMMDWYNIYKGQQNEKNKQTI
jgi:hypothetical protein